ncbi:MAG: hypothetical protein IJP31_12330 [Lachnospiraceae bacterium]|nr:hypothetical protein [Lachnospiraceae bacterium]
MNTDPKLEFYKSQDFMRLGQAISRKQWQSAAMIIRRMDTRAKEAGIAEFEKNFTGLRQCINRRDDREAKQILAMVVNKRAGYLNQQTKEEERWQNIPT